MKILHTSDWHLGRTLYSKKDRQEEHTAFLKWLLSTIEEHSIQLLIIAGDIFDTSAPNSTSQKMYYNFLVNAKLAGCHHIIVIGGNHDSPSFINAPKDILAALHVVVIGNASDDIEKDIHIIHDENQNSSVIVCGVPFLRERDIRQFNEGESYTDRSQKINESIKRHYEKIADLAEKICTKLGVQIPIIATGHLSVSGGKRNEDDGVRETYIGNIEVLDSSVFPETFDYVALGHYHIPSKIKEHIRYCGSPIPMGFGEAGQKKVVYILDFDSEEKFKTIEIPTFQKIESIRGDKTNIANRLEELKKQNESVWLEIIYTGDEIIPTLSTWIEEQIEGTQIEILKLQNRQFINQYLSSIDAAVSLEELTPLDVFNKLLDKYEISNEQKDSLKLSYQEIVDKIISGE